MPSEPEPTAEPKREQTKKIMFDGSPESEKERLRLEEQYLKMVYGRN